MKFHQNSQHFEQKGNYDEQNVGRNHGRIHGQPKSSIATLLSIFYGTPEGTCAIFLLTRGHDLLKKDNINSWPRVSLTNWRTVITRGNDIISRGHDLVSRGNDIITRYHDLVSRGNDIISRGHDLVSRGNDIITRYHDLLSRGNDIISRGHD